MPETKFYAVKKGRKPGIYGTWDECKEQINGFSGAIYKKFKTKEEALAFIDGNAEKLKPKKVLENGISDKELVVYVDGSYNASTMACGYGVVFLLKDEVKEYYNFVEKPQYAQYRNVTGEIYGTVYAIRKAIEMGYEKIHIHYDYMGIREWALGNWKTNNELTRSYANEFNKLKDKIDVDFVKVDAHTGVVYNELADRLAKKGAGVI